MIDRDQLHVFEDLYYRGQFKALRLELERYREDDHTPGAAFHLIQANTFFELHDVKAAKDALEEAAKATDCDPELHKYTLARLAYMCQDWKRARSIFSSIYEKTSDSRHKFKALLGIANTYFDEGNYETLSYLIEDLTDYEPLNRDDDKISLLQFLGNYWFKAGNKPKQARDYFTKAMNIAAKRNWNYWVIRSLYGLAKVAKSEAKTSELMWTLNILNAYVDGSEALFLTYMINEEFKAHFVIETPVEFDRENMRMMVKDRWISFNESPKIYRFLELLHIRGVFVEKRKIAEHLWPEEPYVPGVHDPRIFDIAKRVRGMIEAYQFQPIMLLSGRQGYKLASV